jgi:vesicular inhibitory amino acid transporter
VVRIFTVALIVVLAIVFPSFDRIMAFLGSFLCFTICIILPLAFYLKIFGKEISKKERIVDWFLLILSSILAAIGTVWAFLPREMISGTS